MIVSVSALSPSKQPISRGKAAPIHQQADHDLWVDAALLGVADLAELVFVVCLEVEGGDVVEHQTDLPPLLRAWVKQAVAIWPR